MDPNGWRFSHSYYNDRSLPFEVRWERVQARWRALQKTLDEQTRRAIACSRLGWIQRETADADDGSIQSVQSDRDDVAEVESEQDDHLDRFKSRTRYHQEADKGIARAEAEELERASTRHNRVVRGKKKQPGRHDRGSEIAEEAFLHSGNLRLVNIFDQAPVEVNEDDVVNVIRLSFDRPMFSAEEEEPVAETTAPRVDNRWRPEHCVIATRWTDPSRKKVAEPRKKRKPFLTPAEERDLFETLKSGRENPGYNRAWTKVIEAYRPLIESRVRSHCKSWPDLVPEEVIAYTVSEIFERKKVDRLNLNRGKVATLLRTIIKNCFIDYTREEVMVSAGLAGRGIKSKDNPPIRTQSIDAVDDSGLEFGELLDASNYGAGLFPDSEAPTLPNGLLTAQEYSVFVARFFLKKPVSEIAEQSRLSPPRVYQIIDKAKKKITATKILTPEEYKIFIRFDRKSTEDLSKEMGLSTQEVYQLKIIAENKLKDYYDKSDLTECA